MWNVSRRIGIDLGTATVLVYEKGKGIVLQEPSVVARDTDSKKVLAVGHEAQRMLGRTPANITAIRPMHDGVIADFDITEAMLKHFLNKVLGNRRFVKPMVMVCVPAGVTSVEKRAVIEAAMQVGARKTYLIEEPLAAAMGAGLPIEEPAGNMILDIGGGTTDIAVISLGGIVVAESLRIGGDKFDETIVRYVRDAYNLRIGESTAEKIKIKIGSAFLEEGQNEEKIEVRGQDIVSGLPGSIYFSPHEVYEAIQEPLQSIVTGIHRVLEKTPPELSSDISEKGVVMTGGGAMLKGLDKLITQETGVPAVLADDPLSCVAIGTGLALDSLDKLNRKQIFNFSGFNESR